MSMNIRFPNITGTNPAEQIAQIKSYLYQLVEQLNWMLPAIESGTETAVANSASPSYGELSAETFYELKSLLIQSSDTLNAYYEQINAKLEGQYVKQTEFNAHTQENVQSFNDLATQYVAQTSYDAYKQEMSQQFSDLANQYVAQTAFDTFKQENAGVIAGLDSKYVSQATYDAHTQESSQSIADLQQSISDLQQSVDELQQIINSMQETGG